MILSVRGVTKRFGGVCAVDDCSLDLERGKITAIIGPNGAGKSTLLNLIGGVGQPDSGTIVFGGTRLNAVPCHARAGLGLVRTFQISRELTNLTVMENLVLAGQSAKSERPLVSLIGGKRQRAAVEALAECAMALLERVRLTSVVDTPAGELSGGQKKLLELARALMLEPRLILLDEPAAGVSPPLVRELVEALRGLNQEGLSIGLVEHDMEMVAGLADTVHVLAEGRTLVSGSFAEVVADRRVVDAYLGGLV